MQSSSIQRVISDELYIHKYGNGVQAIRPNEFADERGSVATISVNDINRSIYAS